MEPQNPGNSPGPGGEAGRSLMKREKYRVKNGSLRNTSTDSKGATFVILINHASAPIGKERLSTTSKARRGAGSGRKPAWRGEGMELDSRKKSRRERMMRPNSFDTQEVREIGRKEAGESTDLSILWMGIIEDVFQMVGKECKVQERSKM